MAGGGLPAVKRTDWASIVADLHESGLSFGKLADRIGMTRGALHNIYTGRTQEPNGWHAVLLYLEWKKLQRRKK